MVSLEDITPHLTGIDHRRWPGRDGEYHARCPFCGKDAKGGQTHFSLFQNGQGMAYKCQVCGEGGGLVKLAKHLGIETRQKERTYTTYDYTDEQGKLLYQSVRYEPGRGKSKKGFYQQLPNGQKRLGSVRRVLYRLPDVLQAVERGETVYVVEGEKDADRLRSLGLCATCNVGGAGKWQMGYADALTGASVVILPDNDDPGERHAQDVGESLVNKAASVKILHLPNLPLKGDVSDWLTRGGTAEQLHALALAAPEEPVTDQADAGAAASQEEGRVLMRHPQTGTPIIVPYGYSRRRKTVERWGRGVIYHGIIGVTSTGCDLRTREEFVTVCWNGKGSHGETTISRADLGSGEACRKTLAARGAALHARNTGEISNFLSDLIQENWESLPRKTYIDRYGVVGDGLVLPSGSIGISGELEYTGSTIEVGDNDSMYPAVIREMTGWTGIRTLWLVVSSVLASPAMARIEHDRNPVIYLGGSSGSGKTTAVEFGLGAYGNPRNLTVQCNAGSKVGFQQAISRMYGLPTFFEDAHTMLLSREDGRRIGDLIYNYANKQGRFIGSLDGKGRGGESVGGTMLLAGEMVPEFVYGGQQKRAFTVDCGLYPPLGAPPRSPLGEERANILKLAKCGYGLFGLRVMERVWSDWNGFLDDTERFEETIPGLHAWGRLLAASAATLRRALLEAEASDAWDLPLSLVRQWADMYRQNQNQADPSVALFERLMVMLGQCTCYVDDTWHVLEYDRKLVGVRRHNETFWRILTRSPQFEQAVGATAIWQFGQDWIDRGFIIPHKNGKASDKIRAGKILSQCLLIDHNHVFVNDTES